MQKAPDAFRSIGEVAQLVGVAPHVLRYWEAQFPQLSPVKRADGRRYYRPEDVQLAAGLCEVMREEGLTIRGAKRLIAMDRGAALRQRGERRLGEQIGGTRTAKPRSARKTPDKAQGKAPDKAAGKLPAKAAKPAAPLPLAGATAAGPPTVTVTATAAGTGKPAAADAPRRARPDAPARAHPATAPQSSARDLPLFTLPGDDPPAWSWLARLTATASHLRSRAQSLPPEARPLVARLRAARSR